MINACRIGFGNTTKEDEEKILKILNMKTIAVVGMSPKEDRPSNYVPKYMEKRGYKIIPVRPGIKEISGKKCYKTLEDIEEPVDIVNVFRRSEFCPEIAKKAVKIGAKAIWMQEDVISQEAKSIAENAGLLVIMDLCLQKAYAKYIEKDRYL
jgi:predicted CoA-binding protein